MTIHSHLQMCNRKHDSMASCIRSHNTTLPEKHGMGCMLLAPGAASRGQRTWSDGYLDTEDPLRRFFEDLRLSSSAHNDTVISDCACHSHDMANPNACHWHIAPRGMCVTVPFGHLNKQQMHTPDTNSVRLLMEHDVAVNRSFACHQHNNHTSGAV